MNFNSKGFFKKAITRLKIEAINESIEALDRVVGFKKGPFWPFRANGNEKWHHY